MQRFAFSCQIEKKIQRVMAEHFDTGLPSNYEAVAASIIPNEIERYKRIVAINVLVDKAYHEVMGLTAGRHYFITIRPKPETEFQIFYNTVVKFVNRSCVKDYYLTFEQKNEEGNGDGFHAHIVASCTQRSKGEVLRDTISTFKDIAADNCIEVKPTNNPMDIIDNYLLLYKSKDEHKESTQVGDEIWRKSMKLENIYHNDVPTLLSIKSEDSNVVCFE